MQSRFIGALALGLAAIFSTQTNAADLALPSKIKLGEWELKCNWPAQESPCVVRQVAESVDKKYSIMAFAEVTNGKYALKFMHPRQHYHRHPVALGRDRFGILQFQKDACDNDFCTTHWDMNAKQARRFLSGTPVHVLGYGNKNHGYVLRFSPKGLTKALKGLKADQRRLNQI